MKCNHCGFEASKAKFRYLQMAESAGPNTYRKCPNCSRAVYCEELEKDLNYTRKKIWGAGPLRGRVFKRKTTRPTRQSRT